MVWKPIVVGVDGSPESVRAASAGVMVAQRAGVECRLVHAVPDYLASFSTPDAVMDTSALTQAAADHAREYIVSSLKDRVPDVMLARLEVEVGRAPLVLTDAVRRCEAGLLVLGGKHHRGLERIGGSAITHLVRTIDVPILATDGGSPVVTRVLAAVDLSYAAQPTIVEAQRWAELFGARLRVMHVVEPVPIIPGVPTTLGDDDFFRAEERALETNIWPLVTMPGAETVVRRGRAAAAVADEVGKWQADLLVVGSHGKGWVDRLLIGSTSERLLHVLPTLTLVVPVVRPAHRGLGADLLPWETRAVAGTEARA
jgi:nucleotide-binding universal stress UspA family protein